MDDHCLNQTRKRLPVKYCEWLITYSLYIISRTEEYSDFKQVNYVSPPPYRFIVI